MLLPAPVHRVRLRPDRADLLGCHRRAFTWFGGIPERIIVDNATRHTVQDHLPPDAARFFAHDRAWCLAQGEEIGAACRELIETLLGDRIAERLRAAQGVIRLGEKYGAARLDAACRRALDHGSPQYRTVKTILVGGHDQWPAPAAPEAVPKPHGGRFARDAASLFQLPPSQTVH